MLKYLLFQFLDLIDSFSDFMVHLKDKAELFASTFDKRIVLRRI
jgi:hypothetical protein